VRDFRVQVQDPTSLSCYANRILLTMHFHTGIYMIDNEIKLVELKVRKAHHSEKGRSNSGRSNWTPWCSLIAPFLFLIMSNPSLACHRHMIYPSQREETKTANNLHESVFVFPFGGTVR